jgi:hypothetical protein
VKREKKVQNAAGESRENEYSFIHSFALQMSLSVASNPPLVQVSLSRALAYPTGGVCESSMGFSCLSGASVASLLGKGQTLQLTTGSTMSFSQLCSQLSNCGYDLLSSSSTTVQQKETGNDFIIYTYVWKLVR